MNKLNIDLSRFLWETRETLLNPRLYFSSMSLQGGYNEPIIKAALYGVVAGLFSLLWSQLGMSAIGGAGPLGGFAGLASLFWSVLGAVVAVFIGGAVMFIISSACGGNNNFEANIRVASSLMAVYPINAFLSFTYGISFALGGIVGLVTSLFSVYLVYHAAIEALKGREPSVKIAAIVLVVLALIGFYGGKEVNKTLEDFSNTYSDEQVY
jgi:hypothetical protein